MKTNSIYLPKYLTDILLKEIELSIAEYTKVEEEGVLVKKKTGTIQTVGSLSSIYYHTGATDSAYRWWIPVEKTLPYKERWFKLDLENNIIGKIDDSESEYTLSLSLSKFINTFLSYAFTTDDYENGTEEFSKLFNRFIELKCEEIKSFLKIPEYLISDKPSFVYGLDVSPNAGSLLRNSCMRNNSSHTCKNFAAAYDGLCRIIYGLDENQELLFRALFWDVITEDGEVINFLDRVYGTEDINFLLHREAIKNGWAYRGNSVYDRSIIHYKDGKKREIYVTKVVPKEPLEFMRKNGNPYFDTIKYISLKNRLLSNESKRDTFSLSSTSANSIKGMYVFKCSNCNHSSDEESDFTYTKDGYVCDSCLKEFEYKHCPHCSALHNSKEYGGYCTNSCMRCSGHDICKDCGKLIPEGTNLCSTCVVNYVICEHCRSAIIKDYGVIIHTNDGDLHICETCSRLLHFCKDCGELLTKNTIRNISGIEYCPTHYVERLKTFDNC